MIILTDKMKTALKTDKTYLTNDEILARVEQSSLDEFVKYIESQPKMTKADYNKAFKRLLDNETSKSFAP